MTNLQGISLAFILSSATFSTATSTPHSIIPDSVILCQTNSGCFNKNLFGRSYKVINTSRFTVMVSVSTEGSYTRADVSIFNNTGMPLNLSPDDFRVEVIDPKPRILSYIPPANLKKISPSPVIPPAPPESTADQVSSVPRLLAASATQTSNADELYAAKKREDLQEAFDKAVSQQQLAAASIAPNEVVRGRVYFERDKHAQLITVVLPVAGQVFEFPYEIKH
jgi:hypothetical protein